MLVSAEEVVISVQRFCALLWIGGCRIDHCHGQLARLVELLPFKLDTAIGRNGGTLYVAGLALPSLPGESPTLDSVAGAEQAGIHEFRERDLPVQRYSGIGACWWDKLGVACSPEAWIRCPYLSRSDTLKEWRTFSRSTRSQPTRSSCPPKRFLRSLEIP